MAHRRWRWMPRILALLALLSVFTVGAGFSPARSAKADNQAPTAVTLAGDINHFEASCGGDFKPDCVAFHFTKGAGNVWTFRYTFPTAGTYKYKAALNDSYSESYNRGGTQAGDASITIPANNTEVLFVYDQVTHYLNDSLTSKIVTAAGSFQNEVGCANDWKPSCTVSLMEDIDGDGVYTYTTPVGLSDGDPYNSQPNPKTHFFFKAVLNLDDNFTVAYPAGDVQFDIVTPKNYAVLKYNSADNSVTAEVKSTVPQQDNNVEYTGLKHDSRDDLYRTPGGAVNPGTAVTLRFRTFHNDVTSVKIRLYDTAVGREDRQPMTKVASDVDCYDAALTTGGSTCDFWAYTVTPTALSTIYYRFIVQDGTSTAYYADTTNRYDGLGVATSNEQDTGFRLNVVSAEFQVIPWMRDGVMYQIFPDRFRNGNKKNDAKATEPRYNYPNGTNPKDDQILVKKWNEFPEGYCRAYTNPATPCAESAKGRDYFGGDLQGVIEKLDYLQTLGITVIYFNPIFEAGSDHAYDTRDYKKIDHRFGNSQVFRTLVKQADKRGMKIVLDGVFNHLSSDSPFFDRYHHYSEVGACESPKSKYRSWFKFFPADATHPGTCAGDDGTPNGSYYNGWAGFDSIPEIRKQDPTDPTKPFKPVADYFYAKGKQSVTGYWLSQGAAGWRFDVMTDPSFPAAYWQQLRAEAKKIKPDAVLIAEAWHWYDNLPLTHGDQADTAMGYRFRNAIFGLLGAVDNKGFDEETNPSLPPSTFATRMLSMREDYADATYYTFMNLMDSHDTKRVLWSMTPGNNNREDKEFNAANVALGKARVNVATAVQMTVPGTPSIYYGDEVSLTGDDDPDDRRPFPWKTDDKGNYVNTKGDKYFDAQGDHTTFDITQKLIAIRKANPVLREGKLTFLLTDDTNKTLAYAMRTNDALAIIVINRNETDAKIISVPTAPYLRDGVNFADALSYAGFASANKSGIQPTFGGAVTTANGKFSVALNPLDVAIFIMKPGQDISGPAGATGLSAVATNGNPTSSIKLTWTGNADTAKYNVYRSPVMGGGYVKLATVTTTTYTDTTATNGNTWYYVVRGVDGAGNEGEKSNEASATPAFPIADQYIQYPLTVTKPIDTTPVTIYGQVKVPGITDVAGDPAKIIAQVGYGAVGSDPTTWTWKPMTFNAAHTGDAYYEYQGTIRPETVGTFDYLVRFSDDLGKTWSYGYQKGVTPKTPGKLTLTASSDTSAPTWANATPLSIDYGAGQLSLKWQAATDADGAADIAEYHIYRGTTAGGEDLNNPIAVVSGSTLTYVDTTVAANTKYFYVVKAFDKALNASPKSNEVSETPRAKVVQVTFKVKVPSWTPETDSVYISGNAQGISPDPLCGYCGGGTPETKMTETAAGSHIYQITLGIPDGTNIQYKYTRGSYDYVEQWGTISGFTNRVDVIHANSASDLTQLIDDTNDAATTDNHKPVANWRDALVVSTVPAKGATVAAPATITVTFNWDVKSDGASLNTAIVVTKAGAAVAGTVTAGAAGSHTAIFTPSSPLTAGTYSVTVDHVIPVNQDNNGIKIRAPYTFTFTVS